jgi:hypothetical protein
MPVMAVPRVGGGQRHAHSQERTPRNGPPTHRCAVKRSLVRSPRGSWGAQEVARILHASPEPGCREVRRRAAGIACGWDGGCIRGLEVGGGGGGGGGAPQAHLALLLIHRQLLLLHNQVLSHVPDDSTREEYLSITPFSYFFRELVVAGDGHGPRLPPRRAPTRGESAARPAGPTSKTVERQGTCSLIFHLHSLASR